MSITPITPAISGAGYGRIADVMTLTGHKVRTAFHAVEAAALVLSNHPDGRINDAYPPGLQPRDRTGLASKLQVNAIAKGLRPEALADSGLSGEGAPIMGRDHIVESGNGRSMGIVKAYASGYADDYKMYLIENAGTYGLSGTRIADMARPVLVRVRLDEVDRAQFARDSNWPDSQAPEEQAITGLFESARLSHVSVFSQAPSVKALIQLIRGITGRDSDPQGQFVGQWIKAIHSGRVTVPQALQSIKAVIGPSKREFLAKVVDLGAFSYGLASTFGMTNRNAFREDFIQTVIFEGKGFDIKGHFAAYQSAGDPVARYAAAKALYEAITPFLENKQGYISCGWASSAKIEVLADSPEFFTFSFPKLHRDAHTLPAALKISPDEAKSAYQQILKAGKAMMPDLDKHLEADRETLRNTVDTDAFKQTLLETGLAPKYATQVITALKNSHMGYGNHNGDGYQWALDLVSADMRRNISALINQLMTPSRERLEQVVLRLLKITPTTKKEADTWISGIKVSKTLINRYDEEYGQGTFNADLIWTYCLSGGRISTLKEIKLKGSGRSFANESGIISLNPQSARETLAHELGHHFEFSNPKLLEVVKVFLNDHTINDGKPALMRLSDATGNRGYQADELAIRDSLSSPYIGKVYARSGGVEALQASEVFSSAFEYLFNSNKGATSLLNRDGLMEFAIGIIKGVYDGIY